MFPKFRKLASRARKDIQMKNEYRADPLFLRNEYPMEGRWNFPIVRRQDLMIGDGVELIAISDTSKGDTKNLHKGVHFFVDDPRFEGVYRQPQLSVEKLSKYRFVLTPDFSLFTDMPLWRQVESIGKSRWCGAFWQTCGITVVPTVSWSSCQSYDFCFDGIERGSIVAVGLIGCKHSRAQFMRGYDAMLECVEPRHIICFGSPFPQMRGEVAVVDYHASRKAVR